MYTIIVETFTKHGGYRLEFIRKRMYILVSVENYQNTEYSENNVYF